MRSEWLEEYRRTAKQLREEKMAWASETFSLKSPGFNERVQTSSTGRGLEDLIYSAKNEKVERLEAIMAKKEKMLEFLNARERRLIHLRYRNNLSIRKIEAITKIPATTLFRKLDMIERKVSERYDHIQRE